MRYKNLILLAFNLVISINVSAKDYFATLIENFDVDNETLLLDNSNPADFWESMVRNSMNVQTFYTDMEKKRGAEKETLDIIARLPRFDKKYRPEVIDELQPFCDSMFTMVGILDKVDRCIVADETINAFSTYTSDGMVVALNIGLLGAKGINDSMIAGVIAHEYAHTVLFHKAREIYDNIKRRKKDNLIKGLAVALAAVGEGASIYADAVFGQEHSSVAFENQLYDIEISYHKDLCQYYFKYSRDLEYEADLIAYRFLEWAGYGGDNYIEMLKLLGANNPDSYFSDDKSDHPSVSDRIAFINYIKSHPELKNTRNEKLKNKLAKKNNKYSDPLYD